MTAILHHEFVTAPEARPDKWMLVLAGIYGAGRNWGSIARRFVHARPDWGCILVDLRQHGRSRGYAPPHTVAACVADLTALVRHLASGSPPRSVHGILGHSFGGKVALCWAAAAASEPEAPLVHEVWVVDSTPAVRDPEGSAWGMLEVLRTHPGPFGSRDEAVKAVESHGFARAVGLWMSTNLEPAAEGTGLVWRIDPDDMEQLLRSFYATDAWDFVEHPAPGTRVHMIKAEESNILDDVACARIEAAGLATGQTLLHRVSGGHWVNADDPDALERLLVGEMP